MRHFLGGLFWFAASVAMSASGILFVAWLGWWAVPFVLITTIGIALM